MKPVERTFFASCPRGSEELLFQELITLIDQDNIKIKKHTGGVSFRSNIVDVFDCIIYSQIASRIFVLIDQFSIKKENDIYEASQKIYWPSVFRLHQTFKINTLFDQTAKKFLKNSIYCSQLLKDSIVDSFRDVHDGQRPSVSTDNPHVSITMRVENNSQKKCYDSFIYLDLCGIALSNRGYRKSGHMAPLRENLAASIIFSADWNDANYFLDPMCGTGTLLIESIFYHETITPQFLKIKNTLSKNRGPSFAFLEHNWFKQNEEYQNIFNEKIQQAYDEALDKFSNLKTNFYYVSDISQASIELTKEHLKTFGINTSDISISKTDVTKVGAPQESGGVIIANPPYGERLENGNNEELKSLYHDIGENFKNNFKNCSLYILTSESDLRKKISLRTNKRIPFFNGNLDCRLLEYKLF